MGNIIRGIIHRTITSNKGEQMENATISEKLAYGHALLDDSDTDVMRSYEAPSLLDVQSACPEECDFDCTFCPF